MLDGFRPLLLFSEFPVVFQQHVDEEDFDLVGCEKPSRTSVHAVPKPKMLRAGRHELVLMLFSSFLALFVESIPVKPLCIGIHGLVAHHMTRDHHSRSLGNDCSVRKRNFFGCYPVNRCYYYC